MKVSDLFEVSYGHSLELVRLERSCGPQSVNFVSRTQKNNMVSARVAPLDGVEPSPAGTLSVALGGTVLETALQPEAYYSGRDIAVLTPREAMSDVEKLLWADCIMANRYRYNYGRQANRSLADLELPNEMPEWVKAAVVPDLMAAKQSVMSESIPLDPSTWAIFRLDSLFTLTRGTISKVQDYKDGHTPFVGASAFNNGVTGHIEAKPFHPANTLTVARDGSVAECFFQPEPFCATTNISVLAPRDFTLNPARAAFLATLVKLEKPRYNYGRKFRPDLLSATALRLPVTADGSVDWEWIDSFMDTLPYSLGVDL